MKMDVAYELQKTAGCVAVSTLYDTKLLTDGKLYQDLHETLELLGKKLNMLPQAVERGHISER